jgi:hypothetical protein
MDRIIANESRWIDERESLTDDEKLITNDQIPGTRAAFLTTRPRTARNEKKPHRCGF